MTNSVEQLSKLEKEELVFGYIRNNYVYNIPIALNHLCLSFYDPVFYWNITGKNLQKLLEMKDDEMMSAQTFKYDEIKCKLSLECTNDDESIFFGPEMFIPSNISSFYTNIILTLNDDILMKFSEFFDHDNCCWGCLCYQYNKIEMKKLKLLSFGCCMEILCIQYKDGKKKYISNKNIKMDKNVNYEWKISDKLLNRFKKSVPGQKIRSFDFGIGNNWCIPCIANGITKDEKGDLAIGVDLMRFPAMIKKVTIKCILKSNYKNIEWIGNESIEMTKSEMGLNPGSLLWPLNTFKTEWLENVTNLIFSASIEITQVFDDNDKEIPQNEWNQFGIV